MRQPTDSLYVDLVNLMKAYPRRDRQHWVDVVESLIEDCDPDRRDTRLEILNAILDFLKREKN